MGSKQIWVLFACLVASSLQYLAAEECESTGRDCVKDCSHMKDGTYQSCKGCRYYVQCSNGQLYNMPCPQHLEWDDNAKRCVEKSNTCKGCVEESIEIVREGGIDAYDDSVEEIRLNGIPRRRHCKSTGHRCVSDCTGKKDGDYQSCHGCDVYVSCVGGLRYDDRPCAPGGLVWDDRKKRCEYNSTTCFGCSCHKPCHGTGPCCINSCRHLENGVYQSCKGCNIFATCYNGHLTDGIPCAPRGTVWDDYTKSCVWYSNTCHPGCRHCGP